MISLNHVLAGTAIGLAVKKPELVVPLAFLSHFVLDAIPHFDYDQWKGNRWPLILASDGILSLTALIIIGSSAPDLAFSIVAGGLFAELPDAFWLHERLVIKRRSTFWFFRFHRNIQWSETQRGFFYEMGYLALLIVVNMLLLKVH